MERLIGLVDIAEKQECNKKVVREVLKCKISPELKRLLEIKLHYFDTGYFSKYTPEELQSLIEKEIDAERAREKIEG